MTVNLFVVLVIALCAVSSLLTEAIKKLYDNAGRKYSANLIALIDAIVVGCGGTSCVYLLMSIPFSTNNIVCIAMMAIVVWIGSMIGYDKVIQLVKQITGE